MKIDRVSYQRLMPTGMYSNERIGIEAMLDEGEKPEEAISQLKQMVEEFHKQSNPQFYQEGGEVGMAYPEILAGREPITQDAKEKRVLLLIGDINSCKEVKVLESYRLIAKQIPEIQSAYEKKMQELSKK